MKFADFILLCGVTAFCAIAFDARTLLGLAWILFGVGLLSLLLQRK